MCLPLHLPTIKRDKISLGFNQSGRNGNNVCTREFGCNINSKPGQLVSIERSPRRTPLQGGGRPPRRRPTEALQARPRSNAEVRQASVYLCFRYPGSQAGWDPARGPELVTHPSLAKSGRGWAGGGEGK